MMYPAVSGAHENMSYMLRVGRYKLKSCDSSRYIESHPTGLPPDTERERTIHGKGS